MLIANQHHLLFLNHNHVFFDFVLVLIALIVLIVLIALIVLI